MVDQQDGELPGDVSSVSQLDFIPDEYINFLSDRKCINHDVGSPSRGYHRTRPLRHADVSGNVSTYYLDPFASSVFAILVLELLERFSFYGLYMTQTNYLGGSYGDGEWSADLGAMDAASLISLSTAVAYTSPFIGGLLADRYMGDYKTILLGICAFYLPGLFLIASSTRPTWWLGTQEFNVTAYKAALLFLWPMGTGIVKSCVNVFGARQYHPVLQRSFVETFYVQFYMVINLGAVAGCIVIPILARRNIMAAYSIPFVLLLVATACFVWGSGRYVHNAPHRPGNDRAEEERSRNLAGGGHEGSSFLDVARIMLLVVPFNIVYNQCATTFMIQGAVMRPFLGVIEAPSLNILDSLSILAFGFLVSGYLYPFLTRRNMKLDTGMKFAIGSTIGALAMIWSILLEWLIHHKYETSGEQISVLWQAPSYILVGAGEIFSISTAYEVAFTASPPNKKVFACAFNLFCIGSLPNMFALWLYRVCRPWFQNAKGNGNIGHISSYCEAHVVKYFLVLFGIVVLGVAINLVPFVRNFVADVENRAAMASRSANGTPRHTPQVQKQLERASEHDPLLMAKDHQTYLEEGPNQTSIA